MRGPGVRWSWKWELSSNVINLNLLELGKRTTLVLNNIRELDRDPFTNQFTLYTTTNGLC